MNLPEPPHLLQIIISDIFTPPTLHCADKIRTGKRPELGCVYSWKLWYFQCDTVIHNFVYAAFVYRQIVFISITFPVCRVRVLHHERKPVLSETSIIRFSHILSPFFLGGSSAARVVISQGNIPLKLDIALLIFQKQPL